MRRHLGLLSFALFVFPACGGEDIQIDLSTTNGSDSGSIVTTVTASAPSVAYQDRKYSIGLQASKTITGVTIQNGPAWLTYNSSTKKLDGIPTSSGSVSGLTLLVEVSDGSVKTLGPFGITVLGDPLKQYQWHLKNTGQTTFAANAGSAGIDLALTDSIGEGYTGSGIRVAISDSGVEITHEDLAAHIIPGASKNYSLSSPWIGDPTPTSTTDPRVAHGTEVAGIIGAIGWNNKGGRGVAPNASLAGLRYIGPTQSTAATIDQASGSFDIFNYSYGGGFIVPGSVEESAGLAQIASQVFSGRSGKGSIFVKSAGNDFTKYYPANTIYPSNTAYFDANDVDLYCLYFDINGNSYQCLYLGNANFNGVYDTSPYSIIAGALNAQGTRSSYSNPGSNLWIAAPGGEFGDVDPAILTADIQGCNKGNSSTLMAPANSFENSSALNPNCNYTSTMNGTSSAAPMVSGVVALLLEANPSLTWRDVKYILASTAQLVDSSTAQRSHQFSALNLAGHVYEQGWVTNAAGFKFNNWYGFGKVNTDAAVAMAKTYTGPLPSFKQTSTSESDWFYSSGSLNLSIPDNSSSGTLSTIAVRHNFVIEGVQIRVKTSHQYITELGVELTSPSGTKSILLNINNGAIRTDSAPFDADFQLLSNAFLGESSAGTWTLKVLDGRAGDTGNLLGWSINIAGHVSPTPSNPTSPSPISNLTHAPVFSSLTQSPAITWSASSTSGVLRYEVSVGTTAGGTNTFTWYPVGLMTSGQLSGLSLTNGTRYYFNVRAVNASEVVSSIVSSSGWIADVHNDIPRRRYKMSSIVMELQREALDSKVRITDLLRKALIVAKKLKQTEFDTWINAELNGYPDAATIPEYRWIKGEVKVDNPYHGWQPVMFASSSMAEKLSKMPCGQPISEIDTNASRDLSNGGSFQMTFQPEITTRLMKQMEVPLQPSLHVDASRLAGILDAVRNTILNWVLKLEEDGILGEGLSFSNVEKETSAKVTYHVNHFHGSISHSQIQQGTQQSMQTMNATSVDTIALKEITGLLREVLARADLAGEARRELQAEVATLEAQADSPKPKVSIVKEGLSSVRKLLEGVAVKLTVDALPKVTALLSHLGS